MTDRPQIGQRLKEFEEREVERILGACTQCGKCYEVCPMAHYSKAPSGDSKAVVGGVLAVLRGQQGTPEALGWIAVCTRTAVCVPACPEYVNPKMMMRLAHMTALGGEPSPVGGVDYCCGTVKDANQTAAAGMATSTVGKLNQRGTPVVIWFPFCHSHMHEFMGRSNERRFDMSYLVVLLHAKREQ